MIPDAVRTQPGESPPERRGVSYAKPIDAAKEAVPVLALAERLCLDLRRVGAEWTGRCPLPDHEDRSPSFRVNPAKNAWFCHGCARGGDVVRLAQLARGYAPNASHIAAAELLHEFGYDLPQRPPAWFRRQERQRPVRDALIEAKVRRAQRLVFRWMFEPHLLRIADKEERERESVHGWGEAEKLSRLAVAQMGGDK